MTVHWFSFLSGSSQRRGSRHACGHHYRPRACPGCLKRRWCAA